MLSKETFEVLLSVESLLNLTQMYPDEFSSDSCVGFWLDCFQGFEIINELQMSENEEVRNLATSLVHNFCSGVSELEQALMESTESALKSDHGPSDTL